jgi:hypothetical protein
LGKYPKSTIPASALIEGEVDTTTMVETANHEVNPDVAFIVVAGPMVDMAEELEAEEDVVVMHCHNTQITPTFRLLNGRP